ncbi:MAG: 3-oxoacyl-ACP reductase FabG [Spiribacter sp.]|jgi:3-oxoacyl-[acyl-carrier protein] reductase|nr:3-oxoacyl-ACP reductase FabG [Spiribacter sp.]MDR9489228.1 3-oxoacyl-ACP reductase FabG [Spiribacter sp.]
MKIQLDGQVALVTGASRGIGHAIAMALADSGAKVIGSATSEEGAVRITDNLRSAGPGGRGVALDVTNAEQTAAVLAEIADKEGMPGILVNNAGITRDNLAMRMSDDDWDTVIQTNLSSVFRMSRAVLRGMMKAREGRIINVGSVVGLMGNAGQTNYAAAKAGLLGLTRSLAREVASRNITVNAIAPGFIETDMTRGLEGAQREALTTQIPLQRLGQPEDIAAAVCFLASAGGGYITGETLNVNGGLLMS